MCHRHLKDPPASQTSQWVQPSDIIKTHADQLGNSSEGTSNKWRPYLCSSLFRRAPWQIWANCEQQMRSVLSSIVFFSSNFSACLGPWMQQRLESSHPCRHPPPHHQQWGWVLHIIALGKLAWLQCSLKLWQAPTWQVNVSIHAVEISPLLLQTSGSRYDISESYHILRQRNPSKMQL